MALNLRSLIARLNTTTRGAMEGAAGLCMSRGHYEVEVEHLLVKLLEVENTDIRRSLRQFEIAPEALERELILVKVKGTGDKRVESLRIADIFRARVVDSTIESFVFEMTGSTEKLTAFINLMQPLGLVEVSRTGVVAISRGPEAI